MKTTFAAVGAILLTLSSAGALRAQDGIKVTAVQVNDNRVKLLVEDPNRYKPTSSLAIRLRFKGAEMAKATRIGKLKIDAATDDLKASLKRDRSFVGSRLSRIYRSSSYVSKKNPTPKDQYDYTIYVKAPARAATKLAALKGQVTFSISDTASVSIPVAKLKGMVGKQIEDDVLKTAGLKVTLESFSGKAARVKFTGEKRERFLELNFNDGQGKRLSYGYAYSGFRTGSGSVSSFKALPEGTVLKLVIETKRKDVTVKFDLKDIPLP
ncbi:MAG: hypothetical protein ACE5KM_17525 [Planctomycetaceae bacterium]